jgi:hypothetical protein
MSTDDVDRTFREVYQVIVDQTELPPSRLPVPDLIRTSHRQRPWRVALSAAVFVLVVVGGVALLRQDTPVSQSGTVERVARVALVEPPEGLVSPLTVVNSGVSSDALEQAPPVYMWLWEADGSPTSWVALLEADPDSDLTAILGPAEDELILAPPADGQVVKTILPETGWFAYSWLDGSNWRIAIGYDESTVAELTQQATIGDPSQATLDGLSLVYEGPQTLYPTTEIEVSELFYHTPSGVFSVVLFRGLSEGTIAAGLRSPRPQRTDVNGADAVIAGDEVNWWIVWEIDNKSTALIQSSDFGPEVLKSIAEAVRPVSIAEWEEIASASSPPSTTNN